MRSRGRALLCTAATIGLALACANPIRTEHDASPTAELSRYATYAWIGESPLSRDAGESAYRSEPRRVDEGIVRRAVEAELDSRGYRRASPDAADLLVAFEVGSQEKTVEQPVAGRATVYTAGYSYGSWYRGSPVRVRTYTEGTLSLDFFDRRSREAVWVGWASKRITGSDQPEPLVQEAVRRILEEFPASN